MNENITEGTLGQNFTGEAGPRPAPPQGSSISENQANVEEYYINWVDKHDKFVISNHVVYGTKDSIIALKDFIEASKDLHKEFHEITNSRYIKYDEVMRSFSEPKPLKG